MNTIVLGCGLIAGRWIRALAADARLSVTALIDPDAAAAHRTARRYGLDSVAVFPDLEAALTQLTGTIAPRVVVNLTPADVHTVTTRAALEHGLHVLTEKPLAFTLADAEALVALARSRSLVLGVMSNRGGDSRFLAFCELVRALGPGPYLVTAEMFVHLPDGRFRDRLPYPALQDLAVHAFDQIQRLIPAHAEDITCIETPLPRLGEHCSIATAHVRFTDDSLLVFRGGFTSPGLRTPADGYWRIALPDEQTITWDGRQTATIAGRSDDATIAPLPAGDGHGPRITAMIDALHGGPPLADGLGAIALLDAAVCSARTATPAAIRRATT